MQNWNDRSREELIRELEELRQEVRDLTRGDAPVPDRFRAFFEEAFVPFWFEDWSFVTEYARGLFESGVPDLQRYFKDNPESLISCMDMIRLVDANQATLDFFGLSQKMQMFSEWDKRITPWSRRTFVEALSAFLREGKSSFTSETTMLDSQGDLRRLIVNLKVPALYRKTLEQVHISATDITEMRVAQASLEKRREFSRVIAGLAEAFILPEDIGSVIENSLVALGRFSEASRAYLILFDEGYNRIKSYFEWCAEGVPSSRQHVERTLLEGRPWYLARLLEDREILVDDVADLPPEAEAEKTLFMAQGIRSLVAIPVFVGDRLAGAVGFDGVEDARRWGERVLTQLRLFCGIVGNSLLGIERTAEVRAEKQKLDAVFNAAEDVGLITADVTTADFRITGFSPGAENIFGYSREEALGRPIASLHIPVDRGNFPGIRQKLVKGTGKFKYETILVRRDGTAFPALVSVNSLRAEDGAEPREVLGVVLDLSFVRSAEEALQASQERLELALGATRDGIWDWDIEGDRVFLSPGWFQMLGIQDETESLTFSRWVSFIHEGDRKVFMKKLKAHLSGETTYFEEPIRVRTRDGSWLWVLGRGGVVRRNSAGKPTRVVGSQVDITELKTAQDKVEAVNEQISATLARIVEVRDIYTAGHQVRASRLAACIAEEMGLPAEEVRVIRTAGLLHDIGKITIPTEILNKPGELSEIEWKLIRTHPEAGVDLLKDVPFPPEVAEIVGQHHERWNGSGYPRGLKKRKTRLGSRILAVADVVETMASHRPYRPGKGLKEALGEIASGKGVLYDPDVVEACLRLFREKGYDLDEKG